MTRKRNQNGTGEAQSRQVQRTCRPGICIICICMLKYAINNAYFCIDKHKKAEISNEIPLNAQNMQKNAADMQKA